MKLNIASYFSLLALLFAGSCTKNSVEEPSTPDNPTPIPTPATKLEIKINTDFNTRATDYGFEAGDRIGLYVVNYSGSTPGSLLTTGNHVDNMRFTYSGIWTPDTPIYWKDDTTHADFYLYYPYSQVSSISAHAFAVKENQSTEVAYKSSDFMIGKAVDIAPTASATVISVNHVMSRILVWVEAGNGFTPASLAASDIKVRINGLKTESTIDLASGKVTPAGNAVSVTPWRNNDVYQALIVPQSVSEQNLITVTVDGREFNLKKAFTFEPNKSHKFTVTLSKTSNGINVNINPWNEDGIDNGGTAE